MKSVHPRGWSLLEVGIPWGVRGALEEGRGGEDSTVETGRLSLPSSTSGAAWTSWER